MDALLGMQWGKMSTAEGVPETFRLRNDADQRLEDERLAEKRRAEEAKTEEEWGPANRQRLYLDKLDYEKVYENVRSIGGEVGPSKFFKFPKVMTIFRMYFRLDSTSINDEIAQSGRFDDVEELVVVADVVAIDGTKNIKLPGKRRVVILCRLLEGWSEGLAAKGGDEEARLVIHLSLKQDNNIKEGLLIDEREAKTFSLRAPQFEPGKPTQLFVNAGGVRFTFPDRKFSSSVSKILLFSQHVEKYEYRGARAPTAMIANAKAPNAWDMRIEAGTSSRSTKAGAGALYMCPVQYPNSPHTVRTCNFEDRTTTVKHLQKEPWLDVSIDEDAKVRSHFLEDANVVMGLQATLLSAEGIMLYGRKAAGEDAVLGAIEHCKWLIFHVLAERENVKDGSMRAELQGLYVRARACVSLYGGGKPTILVPPLNYKLYRDSIDQVVEAAKLYDAELKDTVREIETLRTMQATSQASSHATTQATTQAIGSTLMEHFQVLAQKEEAMQDYIGKVEGLQQEELQKAEKKAAKLQTNMKVQQDAMVKAREEMDAGIEKYKRTQQEKAAVNALFTVLAAVTAICTLGATAGSAMEKVKDLAEALEKLVEVLEKLQKVMEALDAFNKLLDSSAGTNVDTLVIPEGPSDSDWDIFVNEVEGMLSTIPEEVAERDVWRTKCKNVAAVGRDISLVTARIATLKYDLQLQEWQKEMAAAQQKRLVSIKQASFTRPTELDTELDTSSVLQQLQVDLDMKAQRMIITLVEMLNIQNAALHYNYLQQPAAVSMAAPTIHNVQQQLIDRARKAVGWNEKIGKSTTQTRDYVLGNIPAETLRSGADFYFDIRLDDKTFPKYWQRVRIQHVELRFTGANRPTTATGQVYCALRGDSVFHDRYGEETFTYHAATALKYQYAYELKTGKTTFGNRDLRTEEDTFMRMTPFSRWKLRVPLSTASDENENKNLRFPQPNGRTQVTITFQVTVIRDVG